MLLQNINSNVIYITINIISTNCSLNFIFESFPPVMFLSSKQIIILLFSYASILHPTYQAEFLLVYTRCFLKIVTVFIDQRGV